MPANNFHINPITRPCRSSVPTSPRQDMRLNPQTTTRSAWQWEGQSLQASPPNQFCQARVMAPSSPYVLGEGKLLNRSPWTSPRVRSPWTSPRVLERACSPMLHVRPQIKFQFQETEVPLWALPRAKAPARHVFSEVMQNLQVQEASRPMSPLLMQQGQRKQRL